MTAEMPIYKTGLFNVAKVLRSMKSINIFGEPFKKEPKARTRPWK
jgi:hypothetical protein